MELGKNQLCRVPRFSTLSPHTVTRPYAGFRHPDRMAPDQTVRGGENDCFIWSGNFLAQVAKFSSIFPKPGIFQRFTWSSVRGVPFLCWYFTFLDVGRHFRNFPEILPCEKNQRACTGWDRTQDLCDGNPNLYLYTTTAYIQLMVINKEQKIIIKDKRLSIKNR